MKYALGISSLISIFSQASKTVLLSNYAASESSLRSSNLPKLLSLCGREKYSLNAIRPSRGR